MGLPSDLAKRALDVAIGGAALVVSSPVLAAVAIGVRRSTGGPVLFRQERAGKDGRPFQLVKLRTMREPEAGEEGPEFDGRRVTPVGRFLRSTSIDELPSLWNVLVGDLSLVGPRPLPGRYVARYDPVQRRRLAVKPGITGWAQVNGRNSLSWTEKLELDIWYVENRSLLLDVRILGMTALKVFRREGISQDGHATMPEFTGGKADMRVP